MKTDEMGQLAQSLWRLAGGEDAETQLAAANLAHNLAALRGLAPAAICARLDGLRAMPCGGIYDAHFGEPGFCRLFALLCDVWSGSRDDPTGGATGAHRHDEAPDWALRASPSALIGPWLFYRDAP